MTSPFVAGQKLRASQLNRYIPLTARCTANTTRNASTTFQDVTGLSVAVEASAVYALDGYLAYTSNATADIRFALTVPASTTGHWGLSGLDTAAAAPGNLKTSIVTAFGDANPISLSGDGTLKAILGGYIAVAGTAGTVVVRMAQNTSTAVNTTVLLGSWIRLIRVA